MSVKGYQLDIIGDGSAGGISGTVDVQGDTAHDSSDSGNPMKVGAVARSTQQTAVADGDRTDLVANLNGELILAGYEWLTELLRTVDASDKSSVELLTELNGAASTPHYINTGGYDYVMCHFIPTSSILKIEASALNDGSAENDVGRPYRDISQYGIDIKDGTVASGTYNSEIMFGIDTRGIEWIKLDVTVTTSYKLVVNGSPRV